MDTRTKIEYLLNGKISPEENLEEKLKLIKSRTLKSMHLLQLQKIMLKIRLKN